MTECGHCKAKTKGTKRLAVFSFPRILVIVINVDICILNFFQVIHIKRFRMGKFSREKLTTDVMFPLKGLDLTPYLSKDRDYTTATKPLYDLVGISHHSGTIYGGHYVATCDTNIAKEGPQRWVHFNDSKISYVGVSNLTGPSAYVLFYQLQDVSNSRNSVS